MSDFLKQLQIRGITTAQVARRYNVPPKTVWYWVKEGYLPGVRIGNTWVIDVLTLTDFKRPKPGWEKGKKRGTK